MSKDNVFDNVWRGNGHMSSICQVLARPPDCSIVLDERGVSHLDQAKGYHSKLHNTRYHVCVNQNVQGQGELNYNYTAYATDVASRYWFYFSRSLDSSLNGGMAHAIMHQKRLSL